MKLQPIIKHRKGALKIPLFSLIFFIGLTGVIFSQQVIKVFPTSIRIDKGKTRTITAVAFDALGNYKPNQLFTFERVTGNASTASIRLSPEGNTESNNSRFSGNLGEINGLASGQATFVASLNGVVSNQVVVTVVDPADPPQAIIRGDNEAENNLIIRARVGEAIEVNADISQGVKLAEWFWGDGDKTSDLLSATHSYLAAGNYYLRLRVTNVGGQSDENTVTVIVTDEPAATQTFTVTTAAQLLAAYNQCSGGEQIIIPAGTVISGHIELPARSFSDFVTIRSSSVMPDMAVRVDPAQTDLAILRGSSINELPMLIKNRAGKIRLSGIKFEPYPGSSDTVQNYYLLQIGEAFGQTTIADNPSKIILDHCLVNPPNNIQVVHAILNDGYKVSIISSWLGNIKTYGSQDSQAVFSLDGRGAHVYNNTYFEAASESIIYGGAGNQIDGLVPTNIEFRRCVFTKPVAWRQLPLNSNGESLNEKNLFENENARRVYVEGSLFSNHWDALRSQYYAIVLKSASDYPNGGQGSPWAVSEEIVLENNRVSHINGGVAVARDFYRDGVVYDTVKPQHISIINTLFDDLTYGRWGNSRGWTFYMAGVDDLLIRHVSVIDAIDTPDEPHELMLLLNSVTSYRPEITDSILPLNYYAIRNTCGEGIAAMNVGTSGWFDPATGSSCGATSGLHAGRWSLTGNVFPKMRTNHSANGYPSSNSYPQNYSAIGMQGYRNCGISPVADPCNSTIADFSLRTDSPYKNGASDNTDPGINTMLLTDRVRCTMAGDTRTCITRNGDTTPTPTPIHTATPTLTNTLTPTPTPTVNQTHTPSPTATQTPIVTPTASSTPFSGAFPGPAPIRLPGIIEAENFDRGGEGIGYHEDFGTTDSGSYRAQPIDGVDIQARSGTSGGFAVFEAAKDEWLAYSTQFAATGIYHIGVRYASEFRDGSFHVEIDDQNVTGPIPVISTGSWGIFRTAFSKVTISAGLHTVRLVMDANSVNPNTGLISPVVCNFDSIVVRTANFDFDGDGRADIAVFRPSSGIWYINDPLLVAGTSATAFGQAGDVPVAADFDGDGRADKAVFRPSNGTWYYVRSSNGTFDAVTFGLAGDIPVAGDLTGDGRSDFIVFRPSNGFWYCLETGTNNFSALRFGTTGDVPVAADYDGDGKVDAAVYRPSDGTWYILLSGSAPKSQIRSVQFGLPEDQPIPGDYDGDGVADITVWRPSNGFWYQIMSKTESSSCIKFGMSGDIPVEGDYDGDGQYDIGVFRPESGNWYILNSSLGFRSLKFGMGGDVPITN